MTASRCRLYLITPPRIAELDRFAGDLQAALAAGDVAALQIRLKGAHDPETGVIEPARDADVVRVANALIPIARAAGVITLINDRPDLAVGVGADGVHVGQDDAPYSEARRLVGRDRTVGVTCHASRHLAMTAAEEGADYVAFGAFFESSTKAAKTAATTEIIEWWSQIFEVPCVAIGGITAHNCSALVAAGADFLAVSSGVWSHPSGPAAGVKAINDAIAEARAPA